MALASGWMTGHRDTAFEDLFLTEYPKVVAIAHRVLGDPHEAEDVAQEVFSSFYRRHAADASYAGPWLYQAAAHAALNVVRGRRRRERRELAHTTDRVRLEPATEGVLDPVQVIESAEQRREVREALARLPERSAAVLALRYSGLSYAEVAGAVGVNINQVGTLLRRAETALRKELNHATPQ